MRHIRETDGALHLLVNSIWGATKMEWDNTVWESDLDYGLRTLRLGVDTHAITCHFALPLLIESGGGLVVEMNDGTEAYNSSNYRVSFFYDLVKAAVGRIAFALAHELHQHICTAVSLTPGRLRSEFMLEEFGVTEKRWRDPTAHVPHFAISEASALNESTGSTQAGGDARSTRVLGSYATGKSSSNSARSLAEGRRNGRHGSAPAGTQVV